MKKLIPKAQGGKKVEKLPPQIFEREKEAYPRGNPNVPKEYGKNKPLEDEGEDRSEIREDTSNPIGRLRDKLYGVHPAARFAAELTGVPGLYDYVSGRTKTEGGAMGAILPMASVGRKGQQAAKELSERIPQEWKDMPIKGVTVDDAEKGFHALNLNHWSLNPKKLLQEVPKTATPKTELALLYGEALGNRMMPWLMKTPLKTPIKKAAEKVMDISGGVPVISSSLLKNVGSETPVFGRYSGQIGKLGSVSTDRNLIKQYLYGNQKGFIEAGEDIGTIPLGERYEKLYPGTKKYIMESRIRHGEPIATGETGFPTTPTGATESAVGAFDDIGGHMMQQQTIKDKPTLVTQDLWKFNPRDYSTRWGGTVDSSTGNLYTRLKAEKESGMLDKAGKPFYLIQNNPIVPRTTEASQIPHRFDLLEEPPKEITFKRMGGKICIPKKKL